MAISRLSKAGKSVKDIQTYFECEQVLSGENPPAGKVTGAPASSGSGKALQAKKPKRRKKLKDAILKFLATQGKKGAHVKVIAAKVGSKPQNVTIWMFTTGKKVKGLKKVNPATYAYVA